MRTPKRNSNFWVLALALVFLSNTSTSFGQTLAKKLSQAANFVPTANTTRGRIVELAQHYKLPTGIEWVFDGSEAPSVSPLEAQPTVRAMLNTILLDAPGYVAETDDGVLCIRSVRWSGDPRTFLNLRLTEYNIMDGNVIDAQAALRFEIHATLHPEKYAEAGFTGGYSYPVPKPETLNLKNISFSGKNFTVRQILNTIVRQNGNALWLVELVTEGRVKGEPYFAAGSSLETARTDFSWQILPFAPDG